MDTPRSIAGKLLVVGFDGQELPATLARARRAGERAGIIVFRRNVASMEQLGALSASAQALSPELPLLVAIDEEGGRVSRLPKPFAFGPTMREVGRVGDERLAERIGCAIGATLASVGVNLDFAPVLDVDSNPDNPVIGDRSFGRDPAEVARLGGALARGLARGGVLGCGKHFPGHGDTDLDSHYALPRIAHDRARLDAIELAPFRALARSLDSIMSAHVVVSALAEGPATLAPSVMTKLLREELGFEGVLFSDDLEMRAVLDLHPPRESAVLAIAAGCDAVLVCKDEENVEEAFIGLVHRIEASAEFRGRAVAAAARMDALRQRARTRFAEREPSPPSIAEVTAALAKPR
jgi:beta-N-acetylhexosaminidase